MGKTLPHVYVVPLAFLTAMAGCATTARVYEYPGLGLRIIAASPAHVNRACRAAGRMEYDDDGAHLGANRQVNGCWSESGRTMYVNWEKPEVVFHELCHAAGLTRKHCSGVRWKWY